MLLEVLVTVCAAVDSWGAGGVQVQFWGIGALLPRSRVPIFDLLDAIRGLCWCNVRKDVINPKSPEAD